ncbi:leucine-rich repeat-containing G-protein coupled receptor 4 [Nematostella vectensis]|uniref:leucine-rich repeat-containing G-protein coupled receptor 4 n=1 Tax=Nematostella vectensis TaxID=45351 RepID=UPI0020775806|nr:leucine-rich repeat-containing G-protein coupled receptor 4 [Nematostella vectensis]
MAITRITLISNAITFSILASHTSFGTESLAPSPTPSKEPLGGTWANTRSSLTTTPSFPTTSLMLATVTPASLIISQASKNATPSPKPSIKVTTATAVPSISSQASPVDVCPSQCACTRCEDVFDSQAIRCLGQNLEVVAFYQVSRAACYINASFANITSLNSSTLRTFQWLHHLHVPFNNISRVVNGTFQGMPTLRTLYLDHNKISTIEVGAFNGLKNLLILNLDYNQIVDLHQGSFKGLDSLQQLGLRYNRLKKWDSFLVYDAPKLIYLFIIGNSDFKLKKVLLRNTTIQEIDQAWLDGKCKQCNLIRQNVSISYLYPKEECQYIPDEVMPIVREIHSRLVVFEGRCKGGVKCEIVATSLSKITSGIKDSCWEVLYNTRYLEYVLATITIVVNALVVIATISIRFLRKKVTFALIGHMAFCDVMIGVYGVVVAYGHGMVLDKNSVFRDFRFRICPFIRTVFTLGQFMEVATSLLVTLDRYLAIVFVMKLGVRLKPRLAAGCVLLFWVVAAAMSALQQVFDKSVISDNLMCVLVRDFQHSVTFFFSQGIMIMQVFLYVVVIAMYVHIYVYVRRSQRNAGVQRESKLARRVGIIVLTNLLFFVIPNATVFIVTTGNLYFETNAVANSMIRRWLPPVCILLNASLNPFLFAYRNDTFKDAVRSRLGMVAPRAAQAKPPAPVHKIKVNNKVNMALEDDGEVKAPKDSKPSAANQSLPTSETKTTSTLNATSDKSKVGKESVEILEKLSNSIATDSPGLTQDILSCAKAFNRLNNEVDERL